MQLTFATKTYIRQYPEEVWVNMATLKSRSALVTGANRGLGLEMVKQLLEADCSKIFAGCRDPDGPNSEVSARKISTDF